jgi:hypothetical protein
MSVSKFDFPLVTFETKQNSETPRRRSRSGLENLPGGVDSMAQRAPTVNYHQTLWRL